MHAVVHHPRLRSALLWVQANASESDWGIRVIGADGSIREHSLDAGDAELMPNLIGGSDDFLVWTKPLQELAPGTEYRVELVPPDGRRPVEGAVFSTLPENLATQRTVTCGRAPPQTGCRRSRAVARWVEASTGWRRKCAGLFGRPRP